MVCLVSISLVVKTPVSFAELRFPIHAHPGGIPEPYLPCMRSGDVITKTSVCYGTIVVSKVDSFWPCNLFAALHMLLCIIIARVPGFHDVYG